MKEKYKELEKQYLDTPVYVNIAVYCILNHGMKYFKENPMVPGDMDGNLFADDAKKSIASLVNCLADTKPNILLAYIQRVMDPPAPCEDIPPLHPHGDEENICPVCGSEVESNWDYQLDENSGMNFSWICPGCGATGKSGYNEVFDLHYQVCDAAGNKIPGRTD